jgi:hypothetical protein
LPRFGIGRKSITRDLGDPALSKIIERIARAIAADLHDDEGRWPEYMQAARATYGQVRASLPEGTASIDIVDQSLKVWTADVDDALQNK